MPMVCNALHVWNPSVNSDVHIAWIIIPRSWQNIINKTHNPKLRSVCIIPLVLNIIAILIDMIYVYVISRYLILVPCLLLLFRRKRLYVYAYIYIKVFVLFLCILFACKILQQRDKEKCVKNHL